MTDAFYWIGVVVVCGLSVLVISVGLLWIYFNLLHDRFNAIMFRKSERRLSIASWHATRLIRKGQSSDDDWPADDWPINKRPFYLSCRIGGRRLFILAGLISGPRANIIRGAHPEGAGDE